MLLLMVQMLGEHAMTAETEMHAAAATMLMFLLVVLACTAGLKLLVTPTDQHLLMTKTTVKMSGSQVLFIAVKDRSREAMAR